MTSSIPSLRATASAVVAAVAGEHDDPQPLGVQHLDGFGRRGLDWVGDAQQPGHLAVHRHDHHGLPFRPQLLETAFDRARCRRLRPPSSLGSRWQLAAIPIRRERPFRSPTESCGWRRARSFRSCAPLTIAAASGCSLPLSSPAASASSDSRRTLGGLDRRRAWACLP